MSTIAKTNMPRISNSTPVLLMIATSRTPKMFSTVITTSVISATISWVCSRVLALPAPRPCHPSPFSAGMSAIGRVATTALTVMTPANRYIQPVNQE